MYGVPADLDLSGFVGTSLVQICLGEFQIQFNFCSPGLPVSAQRHLEIAVEGKWELLDESGVVIDRACEHNYDRDAYHVHRLLGRMLRPGRLTRRSRCRSPSSTGWSCAFATPTGTNRSRSSRATSTSKSRSMDAE
jgi:hypothetical protein